MAEKTTAVDLGIYDAARNTLYPLGGDVTVLDCIDGWLKVLLDAFPMDTTCDPEPPAEGKCTDHEWFVVWARDRLTEAVDIALELKGDELALTKLRERADGIDCWIKESDSTCKQEQKQAEEGTSERVYWHYGYMVAIRDMLNLIATEREAVRKERAAKQEKPPKTGEGG